MNCASIPSTMAMLLVAVGTSWAQTSATTTTPTTTASLAIVPTTQAPTMQPVVATRLPSMFSTFAGSNDNALSLANALRTGTSATLTDASGGTSTFTPATKRMGWGNVKIALALAQAELTKAGITNPTPADIQIALNGGMITGANGTTTQLKGILTQRASGMGWGKIAHSDGLKLGPVVSGLRAPASKTAPTVTTAGGSDSTSARTQHGATQTSGIVTASGVSSVTVSTHGRSTQTVITTASGTTTAASTPGAQRSAAVSTNGQGAGSPSGLTTAGGGNSGQGAAHGHGHHGG